MDTMVCADGFSGFREVLEKAERERAFVLVSRAEEAIFAKAIS